MPLAAGDVFAGYRIVRPLGFGGMGEVYLAEHPRLPRRDALKILPAAMSADSEFRARFNREAELAATLYNPHIVGVHDRGEWSGQLWISMDFIDGPDAGRLLREQYPAGMPAREVADIVAAVADALDHAHARGLLHRDIKPPNILLTEPDRGRRRVLLADFGIARSNTEVSGLTDTNVTLGTVNYAAPEQLMGVPLDGRADQYGLAATAYHLLTGSPMFGASNPAVVIGRHLNAPPPRISEIRPELAALDPVLARALAKDPAARFATCTEFATAFAAAVGSVPVRPQPPQPTATPSASAPPHPTAVLPVGPPAEEESWPIGGARPAPVQRPSRWPWVLAAAALVAVLGGLVFAVWPRHTSSPSGSRPTAGATATIRTSSPTGTTRTAPTTTSAATTSTAAGEVPITFESMRTLVADFYGQLPGGAEAAWNDLDANYQRRNGFDDYLAFWSTIDSVTLLSVSPRDTSSVTARIRYVLRDGRTETEDRWLSVVVRDVVPGDGRLLIYDSERIGPA